MPNTLTALDVAGDPSYGQTLNLTATITAQSTVPPGTTMGGTVAFEWAPTSGGTYTALPGSPTTVTSTPGSSTGTATLAVNTPGSPLPLGDYYIHAVYSGDTNFDGSTSSDSFEQVTTPTTTAVVAAPSPAPHGAAVTLTATVTASSPVPAGMTMGGTVTFQSATTAGGPYTALGAAVAVSATAGSDTGEATFTTSTLPLGANYIIAVYSGDTYFDTSTAPEITEQITTTTTTTVVAAPSPAPHGAAVTLTATVTASTTVPSNVTMGGTVTFQSATTAGGPYTALGAAVAVSATAGSTTGEATFTTSTLPLGANYIIAIYSGDTTFGGSTSPEITEQITTTTTTTVTANPTSSTFGDSVALHATVTAGTTVPSNVTMGGTVTFEWASTTGGPYTALGAAVAVTAAAGSTTGTADFTITNANPLPPGTDYIVAVYSGDTTFGGSTSAEATETVSKIGTTTGLVATP
ncbi:Ig-like domain-containing protein [Amycolatopsis cynarae]|uniref:Ig-like domain-containing protein n=1 Tax=Amycolatopsis cynarae TaxID=2995223 RepID=A0ABY7B848_9PSEU|nr:Ig-like domain-containing protein [Amycolatopsis sp. HUAS 11-8]WAL68516.1 Ig-like domain-containing protein [Amycolatopsis sp. HUAS 11-8]